MLLDCFFFFTFYNRFDVKFEVSASTSCANRKIATIATWFHYTHERTADELEHMLSDGVRSLDSLTLFLQGLLGICQKKTPHSDALNLKHLTEHSNTATHQPRWSEQAFSRLRWCWERRRRKWPHWARKILYNTGLKIYKVSWRWASARCAVACALLRLLRYIYIMHNVQVLLDAKESEPVNAAVSCQALVHYLQRFGAWLQRFDDELPAKRVKYPVRVWTPSHGVHGTSCMRQRMKEAVQKDKIINLIGYQTAQHVKGRVQ